MKSSLLSLLLFFSMALASTQAQNIPDANFAQAIREACPECIDADNNLLPPAQSLAQLDVSMKDISNLTGIAGFINLESFTGNNNNRLLSVPALPVNLKNLYMSGNQQLSSLPVLPGGLVSLYCMSNPQLTSLPELPTGLKSLVCGTNGLTTLPALPEGLKSIFCVENRLTGLPTLPNSLTSLDCSRNPLVSLPSLPNNLATLRCSGNDLTSLPDLPNSLSFVDCSYGQLTSLPAFPAGLALNCSYNKLTSLPKLDGLTFLNCSNNQISNLPALPDGLGTLFCFSTDITSLPTLPNSLRNLGIESDNITCLPNHVDGLRVYYFYPEGQPSGPTPPLCACTPPQPPSVSSTNIDSGQTAILTASGCDGKVDWYSAASGGTSLSTGITFTTPAISVTTTYFASCTTDTCTSATRGSGTVTVIPITSGEVYSVKTGNWLDPSTWDCNCIPNNTHTAEIKQSHTVTVSTADAKLKDLKLSEGFLNFQNGYKLCFGCQ